MHPPTRGLVIKRASRRNSPKKIRKIRKSEIITNEVEPPASRSSPNRSRPSSSNIYAAQPVDIKSPERPKEKVT